MKYCVLQNLNYLAPYPGNIANSIWTLDARLKEIDIDTIYIFPAEAQELYWVKEMTAKNIIVYFRAPDDFFADAMLYNQIIKKHNVKIIHTHFWSIKNCMSLRIAKLMNPGTHLVLHHRNHYFTSHGRLKEAVKRFLIKSSAHIGCSEEVGKDLIRQNFPKDICYGVNNAIFFSRLDEYENVNLADYKIESDSKVFLMFGFDYHRKGVDLVIDALKDIAPRNNISLCIIFAAYEKNGIENIKNTLGELPDWIKILPSTDKIASYYNIADAFISASREEGLCNAVVESAYCNCQVIVSNIPGHTTSIPAIKIFENENVEELKEKISEVLNESPEARQKNNAIQKKYVMEKCSMDNLCNSIIKIYNKIIKI